MDLAEFGRLAEKDPAFDKMIDARQKEIAEKKDNIIVEGRFFGLDGGKGRSQGLALCSYRLPAWTGLFSATRLPILRRQR